MKTLKDAQKVLFTFIPKQNSDIFPGQFGLKRTSKLLSLLGNPQNKLVIIHIAGTSGKGSTAYLTSLVLSELGFKTGLHLSPHLLDIRERCQINNKLLSEIKFVKYFNEIMPFVNQMKKTKYGLPTYFEVLVGLAFYIFYKERVNYAIIETGLGGTYDGTNVVKNKNKIVILTKIGKDHTKVLGTTIKEISLQKTGIIQHGNIVISAKQKSNAKKVIEKSCVNNDAKLYYVDKIKSIKLSLRGSYQKENCALALKAVSLLSEREGFIIDKEKIKKILLKARFRGRFDIIKIGNSTVILDGAHNPQKMSAFTSSLKSLYPHKKFHFLVAFKSKKDYKTMLNYIIPIAEKITITNFFIENQDIVHFSEESVEIIAYLNKSKYKNYNVIKNAKNALKFCLNYNHDLLVITGSLYLLSEIYHPLIQNTQNQSI